MGQTQQKTLTHVMVSSAFMWMLLGVQVRMVQVWAMQAGVWASRCIGSIQYLKNKFGKGYLLEIKVKDPELTDLLHAEILRIFPSAARQERFPSLLVYKVPMEDALPLSQSFSKLEEAKRSFSLEEYSFSLNTLAQADDFKAGHAVKA
ncbi:PREDICTED: ATP-binding cassette sub-family A member 8-like [Calidris pugnax]|uniref:ATP-binding cassette sub-family A member 8-like n=1 Tax=Calidris pugnax TaxID=198806 RepID=UPI00071DB76B|nr:PREDICTED: ATP-binding cassette sub-family A member 8-like [Calidris pugnax]